MRKDDLIDALISRQLKKSRERFIPPKSECPPEDIIQRYLRGELDGEEKGLIKHFLSCTECLEILVALKDLEQAQTNPCKVPVSLYHKARELLSKEEVQAKTGALSKRITLIWDRVRNKIAHMEEKAEGIITCQGLTPQPVRAYRPPGGKGPDLSANFHDLPYSIKMETALGAILFEIIRSEREGYLTLAISSLCPKDISDQTGVRLYKGDVQRVSVSFTQGKAMFHRLKEGSYYLEFFDNEGPIEKIGLPILKAQAP
ncbi:MAG: hypothetical protein ACMUHX_00950 [bacterium]